MFGLYGIVVYVYSFVFEFETSECVLKKYVWIETIRIRT
jgi:hypothetical protein